MSGKSDAPLKERGDTSNAMMMVFLLKNKETACPSFICLDLKL